MAGDTYRSDLTSCPDEIILHIVSFFRAIRSYEPQTVAFQMKELEKSRQYENHQRSKALYALCLASTKLRRISEPILYNAFTVSATRRSFQPLHKFLRTITRRTALGNAVQYIENRLSDYLGNGLRDELSQFCDPAEMMKQYFSTLAAVIRCSPNLSHLNVVSLETADVSLWRHLMDGKSQPPRLVTHGCLRLEILCLQLHTGHYGFADESTWFQTMAKAMLNVPLLKEIRASGVTSGPTGRIEGQSKTLEKVDITECTLDLSELNGLVSACSKLSHFGVSWAFLDDQRFNLLDLGDSLLAHKSTLEFLRVDTRNVRPFHRGSPLQPLGSLRGFEVLRRIEICENSLLGNTNSIADFPLQPLRSPIANLLPPSLQHLIIILNRDWSYNHDPEEDGSGDPHPLDEVSALQSLAHDCTDMLPNLKEVQIRSCFELSAGLLKDQFGARGVILRVDTEGVYVHDSSALSYN